MTLAQLAERTRARLIEERAAQDEWEQTPEGAEWRRQQDEHHRRMADADARYALEHPEPEEDEEEDGEDDDERRMQTDE